MQNNTDRKSSVIIHHRQGDYPPAGSDADRVDDSDSDCDAGSDGVHVGDSGSGTGFGAEHDSDTDSVQEPAGSKYSQLEADAVVDVGIQQVWVVFVPAEVAVVVAAG